MSKNNSSRSSSPRPRWLIAGFPSLSARTPYRSPLESLFDDFPRGVALIELSDPEDVSTWRLVEINSAAANLLRPSIESFISTDHLRVGQHMDLPALYRDVILHRRPRTIGMFEPTTSIHDVRAAMSGNGKICPAPRPLVTVSAFPVGSRCVGVLFEDAHSVIASRVARAESERRLAQTCEFLGAIIWKAEPETLRFTYVSHHAQAVLGYWLERWTGEINFWRNHIYPDDRQIVASICRQIAKERRRFDFEFRMISVHGQILWFHAAAELDDQPGRPELFGVMNDITGLKLAEERVRELSNRFMRLQDEERRHISRELHDSLGQYLTSMKINLSLLRREGTALEERHRALLAESTETLEKCVQEVRSVSYLLHPPLLDELGLPAALRWYAAGFSERSGISVNLNLSDAFSRLSAELEMGFFRIAQESLTNVQRHSGSDMAWITLSQYQHSAEIRITDRGSGIGPDVLERMRQGDAITGVGLRGMSERMRELGGQLEIQSSPLGTTISAILPCGKPGDGGSVFRGRRRKSNQPVRSSGIHIEADIAQKPRRQPVKGLSVRVKK